MSWQVLDVTHRGIRISAEVRGGVGHFEESARAFIDWWHDTASEADRALDPQTLLDATWTRATAGTVARFRGVVWTDLVNHEHDWVSITQFGDTRWRYHCFECGSAREGDLV